MLWEQSGQGENDDEEEYLLPVLSGIPEDTGGYRGVFEKVKGDFKGKKDF